MRPFVPVVGLVAALLLVALAVPADAQDFRGTITGRVTDPQGGRLPGATVTATHEETNVASPTTTTGDGNYTIPYLIPGHYRLTVELSGFKKMVREKLDVRVDDRLTLDVTLEIGQIEEVISTSSC